MSPSTHENLDLAELHRFAAEAAILAGSYLRDQALLRTQAGGASTSLDDSIQIKENAADIVTKADTHSEQMITGLIKQRYPDHKIIGEESYSAAEEKRFLLDDDPTWIIDPLDGTVNFVHLFGHCCVSIGFCVNKAPVVGAIFAPILGGLHLTNASGTLFSAAKSLGAWSTPIHFPYDPSVLSLPATVSSSDANPSLKPQPWAHAMPLPYLPPQPLPSDAPKGCLYLSEWGKARLDTPESNLSRKVTSFHNMAAEIGGRGGKGGMDVCAGIVLITEAGGRVVPSAPPPQCLSDTSAPIPDADLGGRLYLAVRACADTENETGRQAQDRLVREVWRRTVPLNYSRPV
ncbi:myo-inositol-1(or 4)-monophosphatase [Rhodotorula toruloides]|uniref:Myo-inositol-1(Or 4)-monophosphatase n=1 Tax=Rhodotorula toruloides TaxID=5286 RepID=A0A511KS07_RHOTO|nr:myo-inositol-1(or 4)-monophosphatase [Rhodotorula toruloides]